ncbi:hypothetical protein G7077_06220 [Sphingomonas piscis]|uniref:Uncharacterized protein n=1 Tax=Sphingomonas piscis TaxID=2714943 RepID=A0A6G7YP89_9SPHN|nr:hypothetical protein [Sphingomonas piscis]QIK78554.1 hypothetical protein G7077_06220 [Sphingomonas piscis]
MRFSFVALSAFVLATPAGAANYMAKPIQPAAAKIITRDAVWGCGPDACQASTQQSRPAVLCQGLAKRAGPLQSFLVNGRAFSSAELDRCNLSARR